MVRQQTLEPRQFVAIIAVIVIHAGLLLALKNGLTTHVIPEIIHETQAIIIETIKPSELEPKPVEPEINKPLLQPPPLPEPVIEPVEQALPDVIAVQPTPAPSQTASSDGGSTAITALQVDPRYPITRPEYPAASVRKAEEGTVQLLLYVLTSGRVADAKVTRSSGFPRLDEAAMREAKRSWRFVPATSGGQAVASWGTFAVTFTLQQG